MPLSIGAPEQPVIHSSDLARRHEDRSQRDEPEEAMIGHCLQACRCNAPALRAIRRAAELARADAAFQVCRDVQCSAREDTFIRSLRRFAIAFDHRIRQEQLGEQVSQLRQLV